MTVATITDYQGRPVPGAPRSLPEGWIQDSCSFAQYSAGGTWDDFSASVAYLNHEWEFTLRVNGSVAYPPRGGKMDGFKTAMAAIRACQRLARSMHINRNWVGE